MSETFKLCPKFEEAYTAIHDELAKYIRNPKVKYAAFQTDADGVPIDNLNEVAIEGQVIARSCRNDYESFQMTNPSWLDLAMAANEEIEYGQFNDPNEKRYIYFEGFEPRGASSGITYAYLEFGS